MMKIILFIYSLLVISTLYGQEIDLQKEEQRLSYDEDKRKALDKIKTVNPGKFGEFVPGIKTRIATNKKIIGLTFDACGGPTGSGFDTLLIQFLISEKIPATLFIAGSWIEKNDSIFTQLCKEQLFEIENHGFSHQPCSIVKNSRYGIPATGTIDLSYDEIEMNANRIELYTKRKPRFYRPAAAMADEGCVAIAQMLKEVVVSYDVLSGDAGKGSSTDLIKQNILKKVRPGSIVIMHFNHPERNGFEALREVIPILRGLGFKFVKLKDHTLKEKK
jgi:peptidoglycan/xylan/chitin deacetylase (PgdA/CDA1 family)